MRTVAAMLVACYHIWFQRVAGGVDVFFVVAAYFMTGTVLRFGAAERVREVLRQVVDFLAKTFRRIIPSMAVVLTATVVAALLLMPKALWHTQISHGKWSAVFLENYLLAQNATDYLQRDTEATPFLQFWAPAIQTQFYVAWPILFLLIYLLYRLVRRRLSFQTLVLTVLGVIFAASFAYSVYLTGIDQSQAYYNPLCRAWEFSAGALLAVAGTHFRVKAPKLVLQIVGWLALGVLCSFAAVLNVSALFPGYAALIPVGASAILIATSAVGSGPVVLKTRPFTWLAAASFAFYLWHWPILIFYRYFYGDGPVPLLPGLGIVVAAWALAVPTTNYIEKPFRNSKRMNRSIIATVVGCALMLTPVLGSLLVWRAEARDYQAEQAVQVQQWQQQQQQQQQQQTAPPEASATPAPTPTGLVPPLSVVRDDLPEGYDNGCHQKQWRKTAKVCRYGDETAERKVALVGGSHSLQWLPALDLLGEQLHFKVISYTRSACDYGADESRVANDTKYCLAWQENVYQALLEAQPELVVLIGTHGPNGNDGVDTEIIPESYVASWQRLTDAGMRVMAIRDNPWWPTDPLTCVAIHESDPSACYLEKSSIFTPGLTYTGNDMVTFVDWADLYCPGDTCPAVESNIIMYRDRHHLTPTWILTHLDTFKAALLQSDPSLA